MTVAMAEARDPAVSPTTERARAFVAAHEAAAAALGTALAEHVQAPDALATALRDGLAGLADAEYLAGQERVAPGLGPIHGVRRPLLAAATGAFAAATVDDRPTTLLFVADRLVREPHLEARWFAFTILQRTLAAEPERTWQLLRRAAREAADWITVDDLARPYATGIAAEPYRWAELEQLVFSPSRWERRLVGSTIATMTHGHRPVGFGDVLVRHGLPLLAQLIGDADPDVQKALAWAYRSLAAVDPDATAVALRREAERAAAEDDGHRAWVVRDSLSKLDPAEADALRDRLAGIRRRPDAPSTSSAAETAARFGGLPDPTTHPEPPLT
jgi:3-methyladenine DNA glycosylase AlkD